MTTPTSPPVVPPAEPDDDIVAVLMEAAHELSNDAKEWRNRGCGGNCPACGRIAARAARLLSLASLVKAYQEAKEKEQAQPENVIDLMLALKSSLAGEALLAACLRAPTPTPPNDTEGGTTDAD